MSGSRTAIPITVPSVQSNIALYFNYLNQVEGPAEAMKVQLLFNGAKTKFSALLAPRAIKNVPMPLKITCERPNEAATSKDALTVKTSQLEGFKVTYGDAEQTKEIVVPTHDIQEGKKYTISFIQKGPLTAEVELSELTANQLEMARKEEVIRKFFFSKVTDKISCCLDELKEEFNDNNWKAWNLKFDPEASFKSAFHEQIFTLGSSKVVALASRIESSKNNSFCTCGKCNASLREVATAFEKGRLESLMRSVLEDCFPKVPEIFKNSIKAACRDFAEDCLK